MIKMLELKKTMFAPLFLVVSFLLLVPVLHLNRQYGVQLLITSLLIINIVNSAFWFFSGLAKMVKVIIYQLLIMICALSTHQIGEFIQLTSNEYTVVFLIMVAIGVGLFIKLVPLPARAMEKVKKHANVSQPEVTESDAPLTYGAYRQIILQQRLREKPYFLSNATSNRASQRRVIGFSITATACFISMYAVLDAPQTSLIRLPLIELLCLVVSLMGFTIIFFGFVRSIYFLISCIALIAVGYCICILIQQAATRSRPVFITILGSLLLLTTGLIIKLWIWIHSSRKSFVLFERDHAVHSVDMDLAGRFPIAQYEWLVLVTLTEVDESKLKHIDRILNQAAKFSSLHRLILAGSIWDRNRMTFQLVFYVHHERRLSQVERFFRQRIASSFACDRRQDPSWSFYQDALYPRTSELITINNHGLLANLADKGFDFSQMQSVVLVFRFLNREHAWAFRERILQTGFERADLFDVGQNARRYLVLIQKTIRMTKEWCDILTLQANELAMQFGGEYEGLNLGEIDSPTDEDIRLPEDVSTIRGIHCQIPNQYADYLNRIFNGVDLSGFTWQICQGEFLFFDNTENRLRKDFFPDPLLSGDRFLECIARPEYYMVFACIQAYPSGSSDSGIEDPVTLDSSPYIQTYEDFLSSQYQVILLCTDSVHIDIYLKDTALMNMAERIFKNCVQSGFHNIAYITHDSDYVIRREEQ